MNESNSEISKSGIYFTNSARGISFNYKNKNRKKHTNKQFRQVDEYSCDLEIEEKPELNRKNKNKVDFKPSTKQTIDKNEYKRLKKKYSIEEIDEKDEKEEKDDEEVKEDKNLKNNIGSETPPSRIRKNIYTDRNYIKNKIITDSDDDEEEDKIKIDDHLINSFDDKNGNEERDKNMKNENIASKGLKSERGDIEHRLKFKKLKKKLKKWDEQEYQKLKSEAKNYLPLKDYDINKYLLTGNQINIIKQIPELYEKYKEFLSLKGKEEKLVKDVLIKNILKGLENIYYYKAYNGDFIVNALVNYNNLPKFEYKSSEKTAYFDLFIMFISMYVYGFNNQLGELSSIPAQTKLLIPFHTLAYILSSQTFFCNSAKLIQNSYNKYLEYKVIPIYIKENDEYKYRINSRQIIWKQFESIYLYNRDNKKLYLTDENGEKKLNDKKIEKYAEEVKEGVNSTYEEVKAKIVEKHQNINKFDIHNENITITNSKISAPSSLFNQINDDLLFKLKLNLYKYNMKKLKSRKLLMLNEARGKQNEFKNIVKNKLFKQTIYYMNPCDAVQDFLND